ncbi:SDR family NAD(P)-dependent oxidoreductase [Microbacterium pygmaeum]|uniref:2-keto-3-deoxy-L-fuconate dehydrogenase n=1 Tax=Microbacterium pygmaeum TaxID=370764 RepID=A0A1G7XKE6_9MICO|nr:SDR family oxidoreductase [Microbacterium pygmaeum]SDG84523.1 2-keto-3-deoxy-L-fuconate dehydrogenase [Microbacterium pygmaeum]
MKKRAIVTGAAAGIGAAVVARFANAGIEVHAVDRNADVAIAAPNGAIAGYVCDVVDPGQISATCAAVLEGGPIDILVNCAGTFSSGNAVDATVEDWDRVIAINARAPWLFAREVLPGMSQMRSGSIVNISSGAGLRPNPRRLAYGASKAALIQLTRSIAIDYGSLNIRANTICPGAIDTEMYRSIRPEGKSLEEYLSEGVKAYPLNRLGTTDEVAAAVEFLATDAGSYVTGATLTVDGGRTLH